MTWTSCAVGQGLQPAGDESTPSASPISESETVRQILWSDGEDMLDDGTGAGAIWQPQSARFVVTESDMLLFMEIVNTSDTPQVAPFLNVELLSEGVSFGTESVVTENLWIPSEGSAFYQALGVFGGSLLIGDWDTEIFTLEPDTVNSVVPHQFEGISTDGERVTNNGPDTLGDIYFTEVVRDSQGIFTAACTNISTGALLPPGKTIRAPGLNDTDSPGGCGWAFDGQDASEALAIGGPYSNEFVIAFINPTQ